MNYLIQLLFFWLQRIALSSLGRVLVNLIQLILLLLLEIQKLLLLGHLVEQSLCEHVEDLLYCRLLD